MFPGPTELRLIGCSIESIWTPKSKSSTSTPKTNLPNILTKGNFTRDEWNHLLCWFNISHFSSTDCSQVMSKRTQEESGEERVTAKSRPMMSLIARAPSTLSSSASESLVKRSYESQSPLSAQAKMYDRTVKPVVCPQRGAHAFQSRFSREHKHVILEEKENHDRTVKPVVCPQRGAQQFVIGDDETELDLSLGSRTFLDRWMIKCEKSKNDLQWMLQKTAKNILWYGKCSCLPHWNHQYS